MSKLLLLKLCWIGLATAFNPGTVGGKKRRVHVPKRFSSTDHDETTQAVTSQAINPKEAVKVFGRLAEKYIALDATGGRCCYSACTDCEFRLPGGGYIMADQSASRPKWIPSYETRNTNDREHVTKWSSQLFVSGPALNRDEFVKGLAILEYVPPLGGPYVGASAGGMDDTSAAGRFFDVLANGKTKLTKHQMSVRIKELADGEEGLLWPAFQRAMDTVSSDS